MFASCPTGKKAANSATAMPVMIVITCGVLNFGWIFEKAAGSRPSRLITKKMRSEEHTSELQSLMRISYAVFCLKKKKQAAAKRLKRDKETQSNHEKKK